MFGPREARGVRPMIAGRASEHATLSRPIIAASPLHDMRRLVRYSMGIAFLIATHSFWDFFIKSANASGPTAGATSSPMVCIQFWNFVVAVILLIAA